MYFCTKILRKIYTSDILSQEHDKIDKYVISADTYNGWHISCERHNVSRKLQKLQAKNKIINKQKSRPNRTWRREDEKNTNGGNSL